MKCIDRILGESEDDPLQKFLHLLRTILDFDLYECGHYAFIELVPEVMRQARQIDGLLGSRVWLEIQRYLDFIERAAELPHNSQSLRSTSRDTFLEDWHEEIHYDLATEVIRAIKSGQFNPHKDMVQSMLVGDPFQERYNFDSVTPANEGYLQQICDLFSGPWATPQDVVDEMKDL